MKQQYRYTLILGDLTLDEVIAIGEAVKNDDRVYKSTKRKVKDQMETVWALSGAIHGEQQLWAERMERIRRERGRLKHKNEASDGTPKT